VIRFWKIIATSFGAGYAPVAPGTAGAIVASAVAFSLQYEVSWSQYHIILITLIIVGTLLGILSANALQKEWGKDPSRIVMDESVGQWITYLFVPFGLTNIIIGLILFRIFDIWKPLYIKKAEQLPGGYGVMADDILSGIYANIILQILVNFV